MKNIIVAVGCIVLSLATVSHATAEEGEWTETDGDHATYESEYSTTVLGCADEHCAAPAICDGGNWRPGTAIDWLHYPVYNQSSGEGYVRINLTTGADTFKIYCVSTTADLSDCGEDDLYPFFNPIAEGYYCDEGAASCRTGTDGETAIPCDVDSDCHLSIRIIIDGKEGSDTIYVGPTRQAETPGTVDVDVCTDAPSGKWEVFGDVGNDLIFVGASTLNVYGGWGDDTIYGTDLPDKLVGDEDNTSYGALIGTLCDPTSLGVTCDDEIWGFDSPDVLSGCAGDDVLLGGDSNDVISGGYHGEPPDASELGDLHYVGDCWTDEGFTTGDDVIDGDGGNDTIHGCDGNDSIDGGSNNNDIYGGAGSDTLTGGGQPDRILGGTWNKADWDDWGDVYADCGVDAGNDVVYSQDGLDTLIGCDGNDIMIGKGILLGGSGADVLTGLDWGNSIGHFIDGQGGDDEITGSAGDDTLSGGADYDTISGAGGADFICSGTAEVVSEVLVCERDTSNGGVFSGGAGGDLIHGSETSDSIIGDSLDDDIAVGLHGSDTIYAYNGHDYIAAGGGNDVVYAGYGEDCVAGGSGADTLFGDPEDCPLQYVTWCIDWSPDRIFGDCVDTQHAADCGGEPTSYIDDSSGDCEVAGGADFIGGAWGQDHMAGGAGDDNIDGGPAGDYIVGGLGDDELVAISDSWTVVETKAFLDGQNEIMGDDGSGTLPAGDGDKLVGGPFYDKLLGSAGNDVIYGEEGDDEIYAFGGDDTIWAGGDTDTIDGGAGADLIRGEGGADEIFGAAGADSIFADDESGSHSDSAAHLLLGGDDDDYLEGAAGPDFISGDEGVDLMVGLAGDDTICEGLGDGNSGWGETGADIICVLGGSSDEVSCGQDDALDKYFTFGSVVDCDWKDLAVSQTYCESLCVGE